jgi:hypothetical protein
MEARTRKDGLITYRFHPLLADGERGKPINLGTDKALAIRMVLDMASRAPVPTIFSSQGILDTSPHQHRHASRQN